MFNLTATASTALLLMPRKCRTQKRFTFTIFANNFPSFLPKEIDNIKDPFKRMLAARIERLPVSFSESCIMSSCVKPLMQSRTSPVVVLLHGFDRLPIRRPIILVGPSLGAAVAIDFALNHPEARLVFIDASVYAEGTGDLAKLPRTLAYAGVSLLKSIPLCLYVNFLTFNGISLSAAIDWMKVGHLHCLYLWWEDVTVNFMLGGGYNVSAQIEKVKKKTLIIWGEDDQIISNKLAVRLHCELLNAILRQIPKCGHLPHVEKPNSVAKLIMEFVKEDCYKEAQSVPQ